MSATNSAKRARSAPDKQTSLELLASAIGYLQQAGCLVRASNTRFGLALVVEGAAITDDRRFVVSDLPVLATDPFASTGKSADNEIQQEDKP